jgi:hypothetical protein
MLFPVKFKVALAGLAVAGGGAVAAMLGPAGPAVGQASQPVQAEIQVNSPATLVARGAGADVSVTANCSGSLVESAQVTVSLTERAASAVGSTTVNCTGTNQTVQVVVTAQVGKALKKGTAIATATINACTVDFSFCADQRAQVTIQVDG